MRTAAPVSHGIKSIQAPIQLLTSQGLNSDECLKNTGVTLETLSHKDARISLKQELAFYRNVLALTQNPLIGLQIGGTYHLPTYGIWGYALMAAPTLRQAIMIGYRFVGLAFSYFHHSLSVEGSTAAMKMEPLEDYGDCLQLLSDRELSAVHLIMSELLGGTLPPKQVRMMHSDVGHAREYQNHYQCEVVFGDPSNQLLFPSALLDTALPQSDPNTANLCAQQCEMLMAQLSAQSSFVDEVRQIILSRPGYFPDIDYVAEKLKLSSRTLRRRLKEESSGYQEILNEIRFNLAKEYLQTTTLLLEEISAMLGYSDPGNFTHAFKRWTGSSPRTFRASSQRAND